MSFEDPFRKNIQLGPDSEAPYVPEKPEEPAKLESRESMVSPEHMKSLFLERLESVVSAVIASPEEKQKWEGVDTAELARNFSENILADNIKKLDGHKLKGDRLRSSVPSKNQIQNGLKAFREAGYPRVESTVPAEYVEALMNTYIVHATYEEYDRQDAERMVGKPPRHKDDTTLEQVFPPANNVWNLVKTDIENRMAAGASEEIAREEITELIASRTKEIMENVGTVPTEKEILAFAQVQIAAVAESLGKKFAPAELTEMKKDKNGPVQLQMEASEKETGGGYYQFAYAREHAGNALSKGTNETQAMLYYFDSLEDDRPMEYELGAFDHVAGKWIRSFSPDRAELAPINEAAVIEALNLSGIEDPTTKALLEEYAILREKEWEARMPEDPNTAHLECAIELAGLYGQTEKYKEYAIQSLEELLQGAPPGSGMEARVLKMLAHFKG